MKIFSVNLGRNGTQSLADFLVKQGYTVTHFYNYKMLKLGDFEESQEGILKHFYSIPDTDAHVDIPTCLIFDLMYHKFPDAKFINVTRPIEDWVSSMEKINSLLKHDGDPYIFEEIYCNLYEKTGKKKIQDLTHDEIKRIGISHLNKISNFFKDKPNYLEVSLYDPDISIKIKEFVGGQSDIDFPWKDQVAGNKEGGHN